MCNISFNPSSNGNGAGISNKEINKSLTDCFNPSSNGNGAGITVYPNAFKRRNMFQSFF